MASGPITSWQIDGETMETVTDFIFQGSKITADGDCSHEIKGHLLLGRKTMTNLDSILKSRDITLLTKVHLDKAMVFPVVMYGCESWTMKKAECQRINAFELWCRRRLLRVPWTARRSNQSILKRSVLNIHWRDWCWGWSSSTLATWCEELTHWKRPWCWEGLKAGGEGDDRGWDGWMASPIQWTWVWASSRSWWWTGKPGSCKESDMTEQLNWTDPNSALWMALDRTSEPLSLNFLNCKMGTMPPVLPIMQCCLKDQIIYRTWSFFISWKLRHRWGQHDYDYRVNINLSLIIQEVTIQHMSFHTQCFFLCPSLTVGHFISTKTNEAGKMPETKSQKRSP